MEATEQTTEAVEEQPSAEATPQPTVEELQTEISRKESVIERLTRERDDARRRGVSKEDLATYQQEITGMREEIAGWMDDLYDRVTGEEPVHQRKTYAQRAAEKKAPQKPPDDPNIVAFFNYMNGQGLKLEDKIVQEALNSTSNPIDAMSSLVAKVSEKNEADIAKKAEEKARLLYEQKLKEDGLSTSANARPSGAGGKGFTRQQIADMPMEEYKEKYNEIQEALRQGKVK